ncbi:MAG: c-type cytochrome [Pseudomonadota bacterium]
MKRAIALLLVLLALTLWLGARPEASSAARPIAPDGADAVMRGAAAFAGADFGGLSLAALDSHAIPWKLVAAALVLEAQADAPGDATPAEILDRTLRDFGFLVGAEAVNLPAGLDAPPMTLPLGMTHGIVAPMAGAPVQVANLGCAACHAGVTYDATGAPQPQRAWLGMPNTSLDLEAYTTAIFRALRTHADDPDGMMAMVRTLYPETGWREAQTLHRLVLPLVRRRLDGIEGTRPLPFPNGVPGSTNGVAALKHQFGLPLLAEGAGDAGIVSIPDLGHRAWRTSLLADGSYAVPGAARQTETTAADDTEDRRRDLAAITTFFTVPSMGVDPARAVDALPDAEDIFAFLGDAYAPQPFPGAVDAELAARGATLYAANCAECHGHYGPDARLERFPNWLGDVGTDPLRAAVFTEALAAAFAKTVYDGVIDAAPTGQYAAPPLTGLWASAPYLHNSSVPTIAALLTPEARPVTFELGGHALDFAALGLRLEDGRYPADYVPFSRSVTVDTRHPGFGNGGHTFGATLSEDEKVALIAFLKQL